MLHQRILTAINLLNLQQNRLLKYFSILNITVKPTTKQLDKILAPPYTKFVTTNPSFIRTISIFTKMPSVEDAVDVVEARLAGEQQLIGEPEFVQEQDEKKDDGNVNSSIGIATSKQAKDETQSGEKVDDDEAEYLESLRVAYAAARENCQSKWLDYKKTCFVYLYRGGGEPNESLAAFDIDGTIIKPKSNKRIPKSATDWEFFSAWTKVKVQQVLRENQARFVMFTNQNGVGRGIVTIEEVQQRIELVTKRLDIPCMVLMAIDKDNFRKPDVGMFKLFRNCFNNDKRINLEKSFYCGDAVGYPTHSDADIKFAQVLGLPFLTPHKFVRGVKPKLITT